MEKLKRFRAEVGVLLQDMAFVANEVMHGRFTPEADEILPPVRKVVEQRPPACPKADLSAGAIIDFLKTQKDQSGVFDRFLVADLRREVTDE